MEDRVSVYPIIIIIHLYMAINELQRDVKQIQSIRQTRNNWAVLMLVLQLYTHKAVYATNRYNSY